jgi:hypothetical protein
MFPDRGAPQTGLSSQPRAGQVGPPAGPALLREIVRHKS